MKKLLVVISSFLLTVFFIFQLPSKKTSALSGNDFEKIKGELIESININQNNYQKGSVGRISITNGDYIINFFSDSDNVIDTFYFNTYVSHGGGAQTSTYYSPVYLHNVTKINNYYFVSLDFDEVTEPWVRYITYRFYYDNNIDIDINIYSIDYSNLGSSPIYDDNGNAIINNNIYYSQTNYTDYGQAQYNSGFMEGAKYNLFTWDNCEIFIENNEYSGLLEEVIEDNDIIKYILNGNSIDFNRMNRLLYDKIGYEWNGITAIVFNTPPTIDSMEFIISQLGFEREEIIINFNISNIGEYSIRSDTQFNLSQFRGNQLESIVIDFSRQNRNIDVLTLSGIGYEVGFNNGYEKGKWEGYENGFQNGYNEGAIEGYENGLNSSSGSAWNSVWDFIYAMFIWFSRIMDIEIIAGIKIGYIVGIVVVFSIFGFIINISK